MKKTNLFIVFIFLFLFIPVNIYAYSNKILLGGDAIGIEIESDGIYVVGFYDVNNKNIGEAAGFKIGDIIKTINNKNINSIRELNDIVFEAGTYKFGIIRNNKNININFDLLDDNGIIRTGLYVKDKINGIGTLSYIDPETNVFGSLGHEIIESNSLSKFDIKSGNIYKAEVNSIRKSTNNNIGEIKANYYVDYDIGDIYSNELEGIFGMYTGNKNSFDSISIAYPNEIVKGEAYIRTSIDDKPRLFKINIKSIDEDNTNKNILFDIVDDELLNNTGGIVQGMSGSPIIQNNKIIGVVNYVIVDNSKKGYGIFITKMLEEGDKILN